MRRTSRPCCRARVLPVDGLGIAREQGLGRIVNSALLGALAQVLGGPDLEVLTRTVVAQAPRLHDENIAAVRSGWQAMAACGRRHGHERAAARSRHLDHRHHRGHPHRHLARRHAAPHRGTVALPPGLPGGRRHRHLDRPGAQRRPARRLAHAGAHNPFPAIAGRICHHPCEAACNRGGHDEALSICRLERYVGDQALDRAGPCRRTAA
jgi:hypothetical protein